MHLVLSWDAVLNATTVNIDHGIGSVTTPGSTTVRPSTTTTYTLPAHLPDQRSLIRASSEIIRSREAKKLEFDD